MPSRTRPTGSPGSAPAASSSPGPPRRRAVAAIGICSQVNTHVFVDADLAPVHPAISWQDQRCAAAARRARTACRRRQGADLRRAVLDRRLVRAEPGVVAAADATRTRGTERAGSCRRRTTASPPSPGRVRSDPVSPVGLVGADGRYLADALALVDGAASRIAAARRVRRRRRADHRGVRVPRRAAGERRDDGRMELDLRLRRRARRARARRSPGRRRSSACCRRQPGAADGVISFPPVRDRYLHAGGTQAGGDALRWIAGLLGCQHPRSAGGGGRRRAAAAASSCPTSPASGRRSGTPMPERCSSA